MTLAWENLLTKAWQYRGWRGRTPRQLLVVWEVFLWALVGASVAAAAWFARGFPFAGFVLVTASCGVVGAVLAFAVHEVAFMWFVVHVVGIKVAGGGDEVGEARAAVATLERWIGPVA